MTLNYGRLTIIGEIVAIRDEKDKGCTLKVILSNGADSEIRLTAAERVKLAAGLAGK
jgi:hypothetical protein